MEVPEGEQRGTESLFKAVMAGNFTDMRKETDIKIQEAQRTPPWLLQNKAIPRHIVNKLSKVKELWKKQEEREKLHTREPPYNH